jgi:pimeloyl-ACP methyl ester carboxylesterase
MIVFVHGVPETAVIWRKVRAAIDRPSMAVELPGFGNPRPAGFGATKDDYLAWLVGELAEIDEPIDLVGHDWGAVLVFGVAARHPGVVRSWAADVAGLMHPDYVWHEFAKIWQTPGDGEAFFENQDAQPIEERAGGLELIFALDHDDAVEMAAGGDLTMGGCILDLYRSAVPNAHADWGPFSPAHEPGLVLQATDDPFGDERLSAEVATTFGAKVARIEGAGHFWPYDSPEAGAAVLEAFWSSLD